MKMKFLLPAAAAFTFCFSSCKKTDTQTNNSGDIAATFELSNQQAIADNTTSDANDILNEVVADKNLQGNGFTADPSQSNFVSCATVTVTPLSGFPKNIVIDFGTGCTSPNGVTRSGIINVVLTDSLRRPGSVATMTFNNYFVAGYKKEGTITWTNTSTANTRSWHRTCENGKITAPNGNYWLHSGVQDIIQTAGVNTPINLMDDVFSITGNNSVTNPAGISRTGTIISALQKKFSCNYIDMGKIRIQGPNHFAIIDFGNGTCDNLGTISIDGNPEHVIHL